MKGLIYVKNLEQIPAHKEADSELQPLSLQNETMKTESCAFYNTLCCIPLLTTQMEICPFLLLHLKCVHSLSNTDQSID